MSTNRDQKMSQFYSSRNITILSGEIQARVFAQTGQAVEVAADQLKQFMITEVETGERNPVTLWNRNVANRASRNIMTNMRLRRARIKYQSRGTIPRPFFRSINDSVRGTHIINTLPYIGRPSKARTARNMEFK